jgi:hypothetical protein
LNEVNIKSNIQNFEVSTMLKRYIPILFSLMLFLMISIHSRGQVPPPPPPPPNGGPNSGHGAGGNQGAPGAPVGGGIEILIALGALYAGKKIIHFKSNNTDTNI